jgi:hypothetical protein
MEAKIVWARTWPLCQFHQRARVRDRSARTRKTEKRLCSSLDLIQYYETAKISMREFWILKTRDILRALEIKRP